MKRGDLLRHLRQQGCRFVEELIGIIGETKLSSFVIQVLSYFKERDTCTLLAFPSCFCPHHFYEPTNVILASEESDIYFRTTA